MTIRICPECRQIIPEGKLRGDSKTCKACFRRTKATDLIEVDENGNQADSSCHQNIPNRFISEKTDKSTCSDDLIQTGEPVQYRPVSCKESKEDWLDELGERNRRLRMRQGWEDVFDVEFPESQPCDTINLPSEANCICDKFFIKTSKSLMFYVGIIWTAVSVFFLVQFILSFDPSWKIGNTIYGFTAIVVLIVVGIIILYFGIQKQFGKTWIELNLNAFVIKSGLGKKYKTFTFDKDPQSVVVHRYVSTMVNRYIPQYTIEIIDKNDKTNKIALVTDVSQESAINISNWIRALIVSTIS